MSASSGMPAATGYHDRAPTSGVRREHDLGHPAIDRLSVALPIVALGVSAAAVVVACLSLSLNSLDPYRLIVAGGLTVALALLLVHARYEDGSWDLPVLAILAASVVAFVVLAQLPEYTYGHSINGLIHRSLFTAFIQMAIALPTMCMALYYVLGATPSARDVSRYPLLVLPIMLSLFAYAAILLRLVEKGAPDLTWHAVSRGYSSRLVGTAFVNHAGMRNHIAGTFLLMAMTALISLPIGVGTGIFVTEHDGRFAKIVGFSTSMLRAISVFILAASAFSLVQYTGDHQGPGVLSDLIRGYYLDDAGFKHPAKGSFLTAAVFLSLLVIPVIARATEEGLRSLPKEIREGSQSLGATDGHALLRILLPWSLPNIMTGLLLGSAEAAGSVTVLLFISGSGQYGLGPRHEATSLAYLIFDAGRGAKSFTDVMGQYQFSAALLLLCITFTLTVAALFLKQRFATRYRAGISYE